MTNTSEILRQTPLFAGFDSAVAEEFVHAGHIRTFEKGNELFAAGDPADQFFLVIEGWVKLYRVSREGNEIIIHIFGPGETFAEAAVFNNSQHYPVNAQAAEHCVVLGIPRSTFVQKIQKDSDFALRILATISSRQHLLVQQIEQITARTAPQRIGTFLLRFCRTPTSNQSGKITIDLPYDKSLISARLSIQPETFSRALAKLAPCGVHANGRSIEIDDVNLLAEFCEYDWRDRPC